MLTQDDAAAPEFTAALTDLSHELGRHGRMLHVLKSHLATLAPRGLDWAASALLVQLVRCGPRRQWELAEAAMLDPSTVSRYVGQLVREGLVERRPDTQDGRAVQLLATAAGHAMHQEVSARRDELLRTALSGWDPRDVQNLAALLSRFNNDLEAFRPHLVRAGPPGPPVAAPASTDHQET